MPKCDIIITFSGSAPDLAAKAKHAIEDAGGEFAGDATNGTFSTPTPLGNVVGTYTVTGQQFRALITSKPFLVTCKQIENKLNEFVPHAEILSLP